MKTLNLLCLLLILGLIAWLLIGVARKKRGFAALANPETEPGLSRPWRFALYGLVLTLTALRLYRFGSVPGGFNQDGAMAAVDALALAHHGTDRFGTWLPAHFTAWGYGQMSVLLSYCMAPLFRLFGMSAVTARLPMLLASLLGMAAAYLLLRRLVSERCALIALLFLAVDPWHFMQSRWALDCNLFPHMFVTGLALLWGGLRRPGALYGSMVFFALCMYSYGVAFTMVPLFLLIACLMLLREKAATLRQALLCLLIYFGLSFPIYGTMLINFMGWDSVSLPFVTMPFFPDSVRANDLLFFSQEPLKQLAVNARALWNVAFLQKPDLLWNAIDGFGTVYLCSMPLAGLGLGLSLVRALRAEESLRRTGYRLLLLFWLCSLFTGLCVNNVNVNRINILFYPHILFISLGMHSLVCFDRKTVPALFCCYALLSLLFFRSYFGPWAEQISRAFYEDFLDAVAYAGEHDCDAYYITPDVQFQGSRQTSEILTLYRLGIDAEYFQGKTDAAIPYRERFHYQNPDPEALWLQTGSVAWVLKSASLPDSLPEGWVWVDFGDYAVLLNSGG